MSKVAEVHTALLYDFDRGPLPAVVDQDSERCWKLWAESQRFQSWQATQAFDEPSATRGVPAQAAPATTVLEAVLHSATWHNRVCPRRVLWMRLLELIGVDAAAKGEVLRLAGAAWRETSDLHKRALLRKQVYWAAEHERLPRVQTLFAAMQEMDWHHFGER
jgi:hypothetical protein